MKINYSRKTQSGFQQAFLDLDVVFHAVMVEKEEGNVLVLHLAGNNVDMIEQVPQYTTDKKSGQVVVKEYRPTKLSQNPVVELHLQEDIDNFMNYWTA